MTKRRTVAFEFEQGLPYLGVATTTARLAAARIIDPATCDEFLDEPIATGERNATPGKMTEARRQSRRPSRTRQGVHETVLNRSSVGVTTPVPRGDVVRFHEALGRIIASARIFNLDSVSRRTW